MQQDWKERLAHLRKFRHQKGLSQKDIARKLGINQSTVSRRERMSPQRHSDATSRLCRYAELEDVKSKATDRRALRESIDEICSKSDAHAAALSVIIDAFVELCRADR